MERLYSTTKMFHFPEKLRDQAAGRHTAPIAVRLKPTNRCNHACRYCCFRVSGLPPSETMNERDEIPKPKMREIIEDLIAMKVRAVTFSGGGEPLLYQALPWAVERLAEAGVRIGVLTNGTRLEGAMARVLATCATWVRVSMDAADPETYAAIRGVSPREFSRVCRNLERFAAQRSGELGVNFVVTAQNAHEVRRFLALMKRLGVSHVKVSEAVVARSLAENLASVQTWYSEVSDAVAESRATLEDDRFRIVDRLMDPNRADLGGYEKSYSRCAFASWLTVIAADLAVYPCQDRAYVAGARLATLATTSFREAWFSEQTRHRLAAINPSQDCRHHCVAHSKNLLLLDYLAADPVHVCFV